MTYLNQIRSGVLKLWFVPDLVGQMDEDGKQKIVKQVKEGNRAEYIL
jgi:hypothetical protein